MNVTEELHLKAACLGLEVCTTSLSGLLFIILSLTGGAAVPGIFSWMNLLSLS